MDGGGVRTSMRIATRLVVLLLVFAAVVPATATASAQTAECSFPVERTDATGTTVTVESEPSRVVTLNPSAAQTMWEIGARDKVVGVTKYAMNLEGAEEKTNVSGAGKTINNEEVVALEPDLVLAPNTVANDTVTKLREAGLTVYRFREARSVQDIYRKTRFVGELTGECAAAEETVGWMQAELATVDEATAGQDRPSLIYSFYGYTAGNGTFIDGIIERAGARNAAAEAGVESYEEINDETLLGPHNPDWILLNSDDDQVPNTAAYNGTTAVREDQIVVVNYNQLNRPAPRIVYPLVEITKALHPEAYATAAGTETETLTVEATGESPTNSFGRDTATATTTGSGPGFTATVTMVALLCIVLAGRFGRA